MHDPGGPAAWAPPPPPTAPGYPVPSPAPSPSPGSGSGNTALVVLLALLVGGLIGGGAMFLSADDEDDGGPAGTSGAPTGTSVPTGSGEPEGSGEGDEDDEGEGAGTGARIPDHPPAVEGAHGVLLAYTEAVVAGDCETMIGLMSQGFVSAAGDPEQAVTECESVIGMASSVEIDRFDLVSEDPDRVVYEVTSTHAGETYVEEFVLVLEGGLWFVDSIA